MAEIETARLLLRLFTLDDVDDYYHAVESDPEVMRYMPGGVPQPREHSERVINYFIKHWEMHGYGTWAAIPKADQQMIGHIGLNLIPETDEVEVQYALASAYWNQGFATEGSEASLRFGFEELKLAEIIALAFPVNTASRRVMEKLGMTHRGMGKYWGFDLVRYTITGEAFEAGNGKYVLKTA